MTRPVWILLAIVVLTAALTTLLAAMQEPTPTPTPPIPYAHTHASQLPLTAWGGTMRPLILPIGLHGQQSDAWPSMMNH